MSYYILPKIQNDITIEICTQEEEVKACVSHSLFNYYNNLLNVIIKLISNEENLLYDSIEKLSQIVNPYEYIFTKVSGSRFSVSKIKPSSNIFYDFLEIVQILNLFDNYFENNISTLSFGKNHSSIVECMNMIREDNNDVNVGFNDINEYAIEKSDALNDIHFLFYECNQDKNTTLDCIKFLIKLLKKQTHDGICIIKINNLFYKPIIDIIYILSSLYEKIYIIKPNTSNVTSLEKYIVCKFFICDYSKINLYLEKLSAFLENTNMDTNIDKNMDTNMHTNNNNNNISYLVKDKIPYYFMNKIEEANIIVGQQQLESLDQIVSILKNKNKEDKIETLRKNNLQKCIHWCEKYKIPYNKFSEKMNIFLPFFKNDSLEDVGELNNKDDDLTETNFAVEIISEENDYTCDDTCDDTCDNISNAVNNEDDSDFIFI